MKLSTLFRHLREGLKNVVRNGWMTFASISSIVISLFILGVFLLLAMNVNKLADQIESQVQIRVYLQLNTPAAKIDELKTAIGNIPEVKKVTFVSKEQGLEELRKTSAPTARSCSKATTRPITRCRIPSRSTSSIRRTSPMPRRRSTRSAAGTRRSRFQA